MTKFQDEFVDEILLPSHGEAVFSSNHYDRSGKKDQSDIYYSVDRNLVEQQFRNELRQYFPKSNTPILLPKDCRYYESSETEQKFLIEVPPTKVTIKHKTSLDRFLIGTLSQERVPAFDVKYPKILESEISVPWQYFWFIYEAVSPNNWGITHRLKGIYLWWAKNQIQTLNDYVYPALLPNINMRNGLVCLGNAFPPSTVPVIARTETIVREFYDGVFNCDMAIRLPYESIAKWREQTKEDAYCWMNWERGSQASIKKYMNIGTGEKEQLGIEHISLYSLTALTITKLAQEAENVKRERRLQEREERDRQIDGLVEAQRLQQLGQHRIEAQRLQQFFNDAAPIDEEPIEEPMEEPILDDNPFVEDEMLEILEPEPIERGIIP